MTKNIYEYNKKSDIGGFTENVGRSNAPNYFEKSNVRFFGSKVQAVYSNKNNTKFVAKEKLTNSPDGKDKYKILGYDYSSNKFYSSPIYDSNGEANLVLTEVRKGKTPLTKLPDYE